VECAALARFAAVWASDMTMSPDWTCELSLLGLLASSRRFAPPFSDCAEKGCIHSFVLS
jgi:hypothetical protein